ncbi:MAG: hypothetical protein JXA54_13860 [Candidatus Heimdallarchaeota archaeon]|nr:hypothetical protein [Candidatus Heimdallarchaeota archaeon]
MIEFPEAVIITKQMEKILVGKQINYVALDNFNGLVKQGFMHLTPVEYEKRLVGNTIDSVFHIGKYFLFTLKPSDYFFFFGFETSGQVLIHKNHNSLPDKFTIKLTFTDTTMLTIRIIAWGFIHVELMEYYKNHKYISLEGYSPLDEKLSFTEFNNLLDNHSKSIKTFFVGQKYVKGIGNGYLQDIFLKAKIHPKKKIKELSEFDRKSLYNSMQDVIKLAIEKKGRDTEVDLFGQPGNYKPLLDKRMYNQSCPKCKTIITKLHVDGSTSYICPNCQKL